MIQVVFIIMVILVTVCAIYDISKKEIALRKLNRIYKERREREDRRLRLIAEKPEYIIFLSELKDSGKTFRFIGKFNELPRRAQDYDIASTERHDYLFKDGKWYEIVDDLPRMPKSTL